MRDSYGYFVAASRIAESEGIRLVQSDEIKVPYTEGTTVFVPPLSPYATREELIKWLSSIYHELGHNSPGFREIFPLIKELGINMRSEEGRILNVVEDNRNEKHKLGYYPGRDSVLSESHGTIALLGYKNLKENGVPPGWESIVAVSWLDMTDRADWQPHTGEASLLWEELIPAEIRDILEPFRPRFSALRPSVPMDSVDLTRDIMEALGIEREDRDEQPSKGSSSDSDADGEPSEEGKGEGESSDESGEDTGGSKDSESDHEEGELDIPDGYGSLVPHDHSTFTVPETIERGYSDILQPWDKMEIIHARPGGVSSDINKLYHDGEKLSHKVKNLFQAKSQTRWRSRLETGKLDSRQLHRVRSEEAIDVFKRRRTTLDVRNTSLLVALDASGSMFPTRWNIAAAATCLFVDALQPLRMESFIFSFSESSKTGCSHRILKSWKERTNGRDILKRFGRWMPDAIQNSDGESIMWGAQQLLARTSDRKIMIVMSDGEPCCDNPGDADQYTKDVIKWAEGKVEVYGIGIETKAVKDFYTDYTVLDDANELEEALFDVIKRKII
jgi:hypothetical protein